MSFTITIPIDLNRLLPNQEVEKEYAPNMDMHDNEYSTPPGIPLNVNNENREHGHISISTATNCNNNSNHGLSIKSTTPYESTTKTSSYSQSEFNPLLMNSNTINHSNDTQPIYRNENYENNAHEELSLATSRFKRFVDATIKRVGYESNSPNTHNGLHARLINHVPVTEEPFLQGNNLQKNTRWGLQITGPRVDLVQAAKDELLKSPFLLSASASMWPSSVHESIDTTEDLVTSKTIESLLLEDEECSNQGSNINILTPQNLPLEALKESFSVETSLSSVLLGPQHHVIKTALTDFDSNITWNGSSIFSSERMTVFEIVGKDASSIQQVKNLLQQRLDQIESKTLAIKTVVIDPSKMDWIYSSGSIRQIEEILWKSGGSITQLSDSYYQITCLTPALLQDCLKHLHKVLSRHQTLTFRFMCRNDLRDFSTSCQEVLESLAQVTNCTVTQCSDAQNNSILVEISGTSGDLSRALIRLDSLKNQIFIDSDVKLIERRLRLHVPADIREFICGKKDGKLNRIIKETGVNISLNSIGGDSMYIDIIADIGVSASFGSEQLLQSLKLIEGELPAELTFHVPETHHKRMIGHGGKVIQRIMKKWGVYVKFMNSTESIENHLLIDPLLLGRFQKPVDNVIVKTPAKNFDALEAIKEEIFSECCSTCSTINNNFGNDFGYNNNSTIDFESFESLRKMQGSYKTRATISLHNLKNLNLQLPQIIRSLEAAELINSGTVSMFLFCANNNSRSILLEGDKHNISTIIALYAKLTLDSASTSNSRQEVFIKSPLIETDSFRGNSASDSSFKFFPSAVFVQSSSSLSANSSPLLTLNSTAPAPGVCNTSTSTCSPSWSQLLDEIEDRNNQITSNIQSPENSNSSFGVNKSITMNSLSISSSPSMSVGYREKTTISCLSSEVADDFQEELFISKMALANTKRRSADIFIY